MNKHERPSRTSVPKTPENGLSESPPVSTKKRPPTVTITFDIPTAIRAASPEELPKSVTLFGHRASAIVALVIGWELMPEKVHGAGAPRDSSWHQ